MWYVSDFLVQDVLDAGLPPQIEFPLKSGEDKYVLLVSGLRVGSSTSNSLWFQLLIDHITTHLGDEKDFAKVSETIRKLDILLSQIATGLPLDIMPGHSDPANFSLHNRFLGTSGQNVDDLENYSDAKDKLEFMERTLRWRHLAPTAPNTLGCFPYTERDPFFIESCPHVYFVGNQDKFETRIIKGIFVLKSILQLQK
ncbi:hypothetical protein ACSQ67_010315 [Phaseolus vulgaris]